MTNAIKLGTLCMKHTTNIRMNYATLIASCKINSDNNKNIIVTKTLLTRSMSEHIDVLLRGKKTIMLKQVVQSTVVL